MALPYLQVYLDRFYQADFHRTYPGKIFAPPVPSQAYLELEFTTQEIQEFGELGDILKSFLNEQTDVIQQQLSSSDQHFPSRGVRKVLGSFASLEGTKIPHRRKEIELAGMRQEEVKAVLDKLEQGRILREIDGLYELAHDTLALEIANQRTGEEEAVIRVSDMVKSRYQDFEELQSYLNEREIQRLEDVEDLLREEGRLKDEEWTFVDQSRKHVRRLKQRARNLTLSVVAAIAAVIITTITIIYLVNAQQTNQELENSLTTTQEALQVAEIARQQADSAKAALDASLQISQSRLLQVLQERRKNLVLSSQLSESAIQTFLNAQLTSLANEKQSELDSIRIAIKEMDHQIAEMEANLQTNE